MCRGRRGKETGLNLRKRSPATRQLPRERAGAPSPALFGASPWCRWCQAQGRGHPQMASVSGTRSAASFCDEAPTARVTVPQGMGTVSQPAALKPRLHPMARPSPRAMLGTGRERGREGRPPAGRWLPKPSGEIAESQEIPGPAGAALPLQAVNRLPSPAAEMPKIFHPPQPCVPKVTSPTGSGVAGGVTTLCCRGGWKSSTQGSFSLPSPQEGLASPASFSPHFPQGRPWILGGGSWTSRPAECEMILSRSQLGTRVERGTGRWRWAAAGVSRAGELPHAGSRPAANPSWMPDNGALVTSACARQVQARRERSSAW